MEEFIPPVIDFNCSRLQLQGLDKYKVSEIAKEILSAQSTLSSLSKDAYHWSKQGNTGSSVHFSGHLDLNKITILFPVSSFKKILENKQPLHFLANLGMVLSSELCTQSTVTKHLSFTDW